MSMMRYGLAPCGGLLDLGGKLLLYCDLKEADILQGGLHVLCRAHGQPCVQQLHANNQQVRSIVIWIDIWVVIWNFKCLGAEDTKHL